MAGVFPAAARRPSVGAEPGEGASMTVSIAHEGSFAVVTVDNPPVNALSHAVRVGLLAAAAALTPEAGVRAVVLVCAGRTFIAGADIKEFDAGPQPPSLGAVVDAIAAAPVPWIAAIHGTAFGGGLEIALGCHYRVGLDTARVGLPEVTLGIIPGAGGTQRLPRVADIGTAIRMVTTGKPIGAAEAAKAGILDRLVGADLRGAALGFAAEIADAPHRRLDPAPAVAHGTDWDALRRGVMEKARGQESPGFAVDALRAACTLPLAEGLVEERRIIAPLFQSPQSRALRHAFFAERAVGRPKALDGAVARPLTHVAVTGGGLMGCGIAAAALGAGLRVTLIERDDGLAEAARGRVAGLVEGGVPRGALTAAEAADRLTRLTTTARADAAAGAELAIEAVFEDAAAKAAVFTTLAAALGREAILATNTSYLDPTGFTGHVENPARILGLHFFSPAHVMRLVEVVRMPATAPDVLATGFALARAMGKTAVLSGICDGFIGNRILSAYGRLAGYMLEDGALPGQIDAAMRAWGWPMGVFEMYDMAGLQISYANRRRQAGTRDPALRYSRLADLLVEAGREGQRTGRGWYRHDGRSAQEDPEVTALIEGEAARLNRRRRSFTPEEIQARLLAVMANEGAQIVEEGIAERPLDVDVVEMLGYGYPRHRGGPMRAADDAGLPAVLATMTAIAAEDPGSWTISPLLSRLASVDGRFGILDNA